MKAGRLGGCVVGNGFAFDRERASVAPILAPVAPLIETQKRHDIIGTRYEAGVCALQFVSPGERSSVETAAFVRLIDTSTIRNVPINT